MSAMFKNNFFGKPCLQADVVKKLLIVTFLKHLIFGTSR